MKSKIKRILNTILEQKVKTKTELNYIEGDLLELAPEFNMIAHGCNCYCSMSGGIATQIANKFPEAKIVDDKTIRGDWNKLGTIIPISIGNFILINAYTQYKPGKSADYQAIRKCMVEINRIAKGMTIALPKIGAGIAGGDWERIEKIIIEELKDLKSVTIVEWVK